MNSLAKQGVSKELAKAFVNTVKKQKSSIKLVSVQKKKR